MRLLWNDKDGGPKSRGWVWGFESKLFGSVLLLLFRRGTRDAYHSHAFNSISWVLSGGLHEELYPSEMQNLYLPSWRPVYTYRTTKHKVSGLVDRTWVLTFRGPWVDRWSEYLPGENRHITLTHGRCECADSL